jgi:hypothetical protein
LTRLYHLVAAFFTMGAKPLPRVAGAGRKTREIQFEHTLNVKSQRARRLHLTGFSRLQGILPTKKLVLFGASTK